MALSPLCCVVKKVQGLSWTRQPRVFRSAGFKHSSGYISNINALKEITKIYLVQTHVAEGVSVAEGSRPER